MQLSLKLAMIYVAPSNVSWGIGKQILNGTLMYMGEAWLVGLGTNRSLAGSHKSFTRLPAFILLQIETKIGPKENQQLRF